MRVLILPAAFIVLALSGCTGEPERHVVDFSNVDATQSGGTFNLAVKVVGVDNGSKALGGAFVGVASGTQAVAKTSTGPDGMAHLKLKTGQTVRIVGKAAHWTTEDSGAIAIGRAPRNGGTGGDAGCMAGPGSAGCSVSGGDDSGGCVARPGYAGCTVTAGMDAHTYTLSGSSGNVTLVLFPEHVHQVIVFTPDPNVSTHGTGPLVTNGNRDWRPRTSVVQDDPDLQELQMLRFRNATTVLSWTNNLLAQADFELGVGCTDHDGYEKSSSTTVPYFTSQFSKISIKIDYEVGGDHSGWSPCKGYQAGPITDSANTNPPVTISNDLTFRGRSTIIPIGE